MATKYRNTHGVVEREIRGERVLVPLASSEDALDSLYVLNETAGMVWDALGNGDGPDDVCRALLETFDVAPDAVLADVEETIQSLVETGMLIENDES